MIADPTDVAIRDASGNILTTLSAAPGTTTQLTGSAAWNHISLKADPTAFTWAVEGNIGTIDASGNFTATAPGTGTITASAGGRTASVTVTVSNLALQTVEDFEAGVGTVGSGMGLTASWNTAGENVRLGRGSLRLDYTDLSYGAATIGASYAVSSLHPQMNLWVRGDGSGNTLYLLTSDGMTTGRTAICTLSSTDWQLCTVALPAGTTALTGFSVEGVTTQAVDPVTGEVYTTLTTAGAGTLYLDQLTATYNNTVDTAVPTIT